MGPEQVDTAKAVRNAHAWFEVNSGWAPPDPETLDEWLADGVCRCPDECLVGPDGWCGHGLASWALILADLAELDRRLTLRKAQAGGATARVRRDPNACVSTRSRSCDTADSKDIFDSADPSSARAPDTTTFSRSGPHR